LSKPRNSFLSILRQIEELRGTTAMLNVHVVLLIKNHNNQRRYNMITSNRAIQNTRKLNRDTEIDLLTGSFYKGMEIYRGVYTQHFFSNATKTLVVHIKTTTQYYVRTNSGNYAKAKLSEADISTYEDNLRRTLKIRFF
jgi:hypothetical protein